LWSLPEFDSLEAVRAWWQAAGPAATVGVVAAAGLQVLPTIAHVLTHFDWQLTPVLARLEAQAPLCSRLSEQWPGGRWVPLADLADVGLPAPVRKLLAP